MPEDKKLYDLVAYAEDYTESCMGCEVGSYASKFLHECFLSREDAIKTAARFLASLGHREHRTHEILIFETCDSQLFRDEIASATEQEEARVREEARVKELLEEEEEKLEQLVDKRRQLAQLKKELGDE